ncbi:TIGR02266 family protein [Polyangium jinanense]|uniref:TIGR02266 family protein n=1 Tax=Polyangium jinanense TaxID=2829994 RepID=A0A9X3X6Q8_9BACT|nr:TIGR02266 family protein [Polyangium jinanense]MDC3962705.1 TIGR02266 family protein [Polyangium jinanense]MDC3984909.1 TIGR02266 family protein [Polyangium jinanense]
MGERHGSDPERGAVDEAATEDKPPSSTRGDEAPSPSRPSWFERRSSERYDVTWSVDCETEETFLYAAITNISELGIFVRTTDPLPVGTSLTLRFAPPNSEDSFVLEGTVQWINAVRPLHDNPNPGMGVRFVHITAAERERLVDTIRTIAYLREAAGPTSN